MIPLKTYLKNNTNFKDLGRTIYLLKRCTSLHYFLSNNEFTKKDNNVRIRYDGRKNLSKTGSHFKKSYILEDLKICSKIQ